MSGNNNLRRPKKMYFDKTSTGYDEYFSLCHKGRQFYFLNDFLMKLDVENGDWHDMIMFANFFNNFAIQNIMTIQNAKTLRNDLAHMNGIITRLQSYVMFWSDDYDAMREMWIEYVFFFIDKFSKDWLQKITHEFTSLKLLQYDKERDPVGWERSIASMCKAINNFKEVAE